MRDKREKFVKLAESRVTKATQTIRLIGNLSNSTNYSYSSEDAQKIIATLDGEVKLLRAKFHAVLNKRSAENFRLN